jgi:ATP-dependent Clp protease protease subunit
MSHYYLPSIIEQGPGGGERSMDIYSRLLKDRIIFIGTEIQDQVANAIVAQILFLWMEDRSRPINLYINSPGGQITAGLAIIDTLLYTGCEVNTYCIGQAVSMSALLLAAGTKGKRFALPHSRMMLHQPYGGVGGTAQDIAVQAKELVELKKISSTLMARFTGQTLEKVIQVSERGIYMDPLSAKEFGLIDQIASPPTPEGTPK